MRRRVVRRSVPSGLSRVPLWGLRIGELAVTGAALAAVTVSAATPAVAPAALAAPPAPGSAPRALVLATALAPAPAAAAPTAPVAAPSAKAAAPAATAVAALTPARRHRPSGTPAPATPVLFDPARAAGAPPVGSVHATLPPVVYAVAPGGDDHAAGSLTAPWATVVHAVSAAPAGSTIVLRAGTYHENVVFPYGKTLTVENYPGEAVWFDGASAVTGWTQAGTGVWEHDGWTANFSHLDPTGVMVTPQAPMAGYPDQAWLDGTPLTQVGSLAALTPGSFFVDTTNQKLYLGSDPTGHELDATTLSDAIYINKGTGSVLRGFGVRRYATPLADMGTVKAYANNVTVDGLDVEQSATTGLSVLGSSVTVSRTTLSNNGLLGLQADASDGLAVTGLVADGNNREHFATGQAAGGMKVTRSRNLSVSGSRFDSNVGIGLWFDQSVKGATVTGSVMRANTTNGMQFEISAQLLFADNVVLDNLENGIRILESSESEVRQNLFAGNGSQIDLFDGSRVGSDPNAYGQDHRYPVPDPDLTWEVQQDTVSGNLLIADSGQTRPLLGYDDSRHLFNASARGVTADGDVFWRPSSTSPVWTANWGMYPSPGMTVGTTLGQFTTKTGVEAHGREFLGGSDPVTRTATGALLTVPALAVPAPALDAAVAALLGLAAGAQLPAGPLPTGATQVIPATVMVPGRPLPRGLCLPVAYGPVLACAGQ